MRLIFCVALFLSGSKCYSQADSVYQHSTLFTISPSAFLNTFPGFQLGVEHFIASEKTLEFEVARLFKFSTEGQRPQTKSGLRMKLGYKKFLSRQAIFLATLYYRNTQHEFEEWIFRDQGNFEQLVNYTSTKRMIGPTIGLGMTNVIKYPFYLESAINIGAGSYKVIRSDFPEDTLDVDNFFFDIYHEPGNYLYPIIGFSLKFKYGLIKR